MEAAGAATRSHKLNDLQYTDPASGQAGHAYRTDPRVRGIAGLNMSGTGLSGPGNARQPADADFRLGKAGGPGGSEPECPAAAIERPRVDAAAASAGIQARRLLTHEGGVPGSA
jgi:hypothetical protein